MASKDGLMETTPPITQISITCISIVTKLTGEKNIGKFKRIHILTIHIKESIMNLN